MNQESLVVLASGSAHAAISTLGAEPQDWRVDGNSLIWPGDPAWWPKQSPILFPVVGWTRNGEMRIRGKRYPLGLHGFASAQGFTIEEKSNESVRLSLSDNAATRALYPFGFVLEVKYTLSPTSLAANFTVHNLGAEALPYALGLHPGFVFPLAGGSPRAHEIVFGKSVSSQVPRIAPGGLIARDSRKVPLESGRLRLAPELFSNDALCFLDAASTDVAYVNGRGHAIEISVEDFPHVALWTKPGAPFLCIECWTGHSDPEGFEGEIVEKPSMRSLAPGASARHGVTYEWRAVS
ncbi:MAG: aldose 1-epimerase family protein [Beijerinckiaceae bacterium]